MGKGKRSRKAAAAVSSQTVEVAERHDFDISGLGHESTYVVNVSETIALAVPTVYNCVRIIADLVSDADIQEMRGSDILEPSRLTLRPMLGEKPNVVTRRDWIWLNVACMALYNGVYWQEIGVDSAGSPLSILPVAPTRISWDGKEWRKDGIVIDGNRLRYVRRTSWPTVTSDIGTVIRLARDVIAAAWAAEAYRADFWQAGGAPVIVITTDQALSGPQAEEIRDRYAEQRNTNPGKPAVIGRGGKIEPLGIDAAADSSAMAAEKLGSEIAKYFGVPAWLANVPAAAGSLVYQNAASAGLDLVRYTLKPGYAGPLGDAWSDELPGGYLTGRRVNLGLNHLTEGTVLEQYQAFALATGGRAWMLPSDVHRKLGMPIDFTLDEAGAPAPEMESIPNA